MPTQRSPAGPALTVLAAGAAGRGRRLVVVAAAVLAVVGAWATAASAHAELVETIPAGDARGLEPVEEVVLRFSEPVRVASDGLRVLDASGQLVSGASVARGDEVVAPTGTTDDGWYVATYRVVSSDGHPISGAFTFEVGTSEGRAPTAVVAPTAPPAAVAGWRIGRLAVALGAMVVVGTTVVGALVAAPAFGALRRLARAGGALLAAGGAASAVSAGPYLLGTGWADLSAPGVAAAAAQALAGVLAVALSTVGPTGPTAALAGLSGAVGLATLALVGHAASRSPLSQASLVAHLWAAALWLGAVPALAVVLASGGSHRWEVLRRFSRIATWAMPLVLVTGTATAWQLVGSLGRLASAWGYALGAKVLIVGVAAVVGAYTRWSAMPRGRRSVAATLAAEAVLLVAVLAATGVVTLYRAPAIARTDGPPAVDQRAVFEAALDGGAGRLELIVDPPIDGRRVVHLSLWDQAGRPLAVEEAEVVVSSPELGVGAIAVPLDRFGPAHFLGPLDGVVQAGDWTVEATIVVDPFTTSTHRFELPG